MTVKNKWNSHFYTVKEIKDNSVTLEREDGTVFTISKSEYFFSYSERNQLTEYNILGIL